MKRFAISVILLFASQNSHADLFGGDLPLLAQIVANTLQTLHQLNAQTRLMQDEMSGIKDRIIRLRTVSEIVEPGNWDQWRDPGEALRRLNRIYYTLPKEYQSPKSREIEAELTRAMNMIARVKPEAKAAFLSGKEMELRATTASPGVAEKLTASGVGTLISMEAQTQVIQSHITSLMAQMLAQANENEARSVAARGASLSAVSTNLGQDRGWFSNHVLPLRWQR